MVSKLLKIEQGVVVLLPEEALETLGLTTDSEVTITIDPERSQIVITPASTPLAGVNEEFARQVSEFIEQYRPALEALAQ